MHTATDIEKHMLKIPRYMVHNGYPRAAELRGLGAFHVWRRIGYRSTASAKIVLDKHRDPDAHRLLFVTVPADQAIVEHLERVAACDLCAVVVDVFFPITRPGAIVAGPDTTEGSADAAVEFWLEPQHREAGLRAIAGADAVTTPWPSCAGVPGWIDDLSDLNPNVVLLADTSTMRVPIFGHVLDSTWRMVLQRKAGIDHDPRMEG